MKHKAKPQNGIKVYKSEKKNPYKSGIQKLLLAAVNAAAVWFVMSAVWQTVFSVFPSPADIRMIYTVFMFFAVFSTAVFYVKKKRLCVILYIMIAACLLWLNRDFIPNVLNYLTDSYIIRQIPDINVPRAGVEELYNSIGASSVPVYHVEMMPEGQFCFILGLLLALLFLILSTALHYRRAKWLPALIMLAPFVFVLISGYVPSLLSGWMLVIAGGFYYAVCGCESGRAAFLRGVSAVVCLGITAAALTAAGIPIEKYKTAEDGAYRKTHDFIKKDIITEIKDKVKETDEKKETPAPTDAPEETPVKTPTEPPYEPSEQDPDDHAEGYGIFGEVSFAVQNIFSGRVQNYSDGMNHLNDLDRYKPSHGRYMTLTLQEKPEKTVYYPLFYGSSYENGAWFDDMPGPISESNIWKDDRKIKDEIISEGYYEYEGKLDRLEKLCEPYVGKPVSEISDFISKEFEENTVYDYEPGVTPEGKDFAEYFLFENKKGFCVHFATTAALMYRICGYPSRYVQGCAIPASAFVKQKDGTYAAEVTGDMGHAWCEVYDEKQGWMLMEHTLAYKGEAPEGRLPASDSVKERNYELREYRMRMLPYITAAAVILAAIIFLAARMTIIRKKRKRSFKSANGGILSVYKNIYEIGQFFEKCCADPLSGKGYEHIKKICPKKWLCSKKWEEELEWIYRMSMEIMFYDKIADRTERKRAAKFYFSFSREMLGRTKGWQRFRYRYLKCF